MLASGCRQVAAEEVTEHHALVSIRYVNDVWVM